MKPKLTRACASAFSHLLALMIAAQLLAAATARADDFQGATHLMPFDEDTIAYSKTKAQGSIPTLQEKIDGGQVKLKFDPQFGYLPAVLAALGVPKSSQGLVFSKTSFQRERIAPGHPRAVYFNDDTYVGYVPGSPLLEFSIVDPKLGAVFYTLEQADVAKPRFSRNDQCLECHASAKTMGVPGHVIRSFATDDSGVVDLSSGVSLVTHRTPLAERWGGWYVTGEHGAQTHRGNLVGKAAYAKQEEKPNHLGNLTSLARFFDTQDYLHGSSDIVALLVLEHQYHLHNFLTRLNYEATVSLQQYGHLNYLKSKVEGLVRYLLFAEEAPLTSAITGNTDFAKTFAASGPKDRRGRSLREFDLRTRLFKYPCSYLIYSHAFTHLPPAAREKVYARLLEVLSGKDSSADFQKIPFATKQAILEILVDTKPDLPANWRS
ncbi:hypothetical protein LBMAG56_50200 [Verrucomicrobiota bacterium]|nr:hypothetical protein LBMAG56_50200 [Verrucomicrobiota bacterium]